MHLPNFDYQADNRDRFNSMQTNNRKYFSKFYYKINLLCVLVGIGIGVMICVFQSAINEELVSFERYISYTIFSVIMTVVVTNFIYVYECTVAPEKKSLWKFVLIYNIGLIVGTEISYLTISLVYHIPYNFKNHLGDYRLSLLIGWVLAVIIYLYRAQQAAMKAKLKEKELDLVKMKQLKTEAELQTLQSKINPHFLYNSLNSIAGLVHEDADKAEDMTLKLSRLFRYSINSPRENMATVTEEVEIVNTYLDIEKVRFGDRLSFTMHMDPSLQSNLIPRFLV